MSKFPLIALAVSLAFTNATAFADDAVQIGPGGVRIDAGHDHDHGHSVGVVRDHDDHRHIDADHHDTGDRDGHHDAVVVHPDDHHDR